MRVFAVSHTVPSSSLSHSFNPSSRVIHASLFLSVSGPLVHSARVFCAALSRTHSRRRTSERRWESEGVRVGAREKTQRTAWGERCSVFGWGTGRGSGNRDEVERREGGEKASCRSVWRGGASFQNGRLVGADEPPCSFLNGGRGGQKSGTAPLLSVSLSPFGGVQSSRASRATRTRVLFYVLGSVKDSLSASSDASLIRSHAFRESPARRPDRTDWKPKGVAKPERNSSLNNEFLEVSRVVPGCESLLLVFFPPRTESESGSPLAYQPSGQWTARHTEPDRLLRTEATEHPHFFFWSS